MRLWTWLPLVLFGGLLVVALVGLRRSPDTTVASRLVGRPMPMLALRAATAQRPGLGSSTADGPRLVNIFASWCVPCAIEAPVLGRLAQAGVAIDGVAIRDRRADLDRFLSRYGNPYRAIGDDRDSRVQIALGSAGVPETFVVDASGVIRHQHIGPVTEGDAPLVLAKLRDAR